MSLSSHVFKYAGVKPGKELLSHCPEKQKLLLWPLLQPRGTESLKNTAPNVFEKWIPYALTGTGARRLVERELQRAQQQNDQFLKDQQQKEAKELQIRTKEEERKEIQAKKMLDSGLPVLLADGSWSQPALNPSRISEKLNYKDAKFLFAEVNKQVITHSEEVEEGSFFYSLVGCKNTRQLPIALQAMARAYSSKSNIEPEVIQQCKCYYFTEVIPLYRLFKNKFARPGGFDKFAKKLLTSYGSTFPMILSEEQHGKLGQMLIRAFVFENFTGFTDPIDQSELRFKYYHGLGKAKFKDLIPVVKEFNEGSRRGTIWYREEQKNLASVPIHPSSMMVIAAQDYALDKSAFAKLEKVEAPKSVKETEHESSPLNHPTSSQNMNLLQFLKTNTKFSRVRMGGPAAYTEAVKGMNELKYRAPMKVERLGKAYVEFSSKKSGSKKDQELD